MPREAPYGSETAKRRAERRKPWNKGKLTGRSRRFGPKHGLVDSEQEQIHPAARYRAPASLR